MLDIIRKKASAWGVKIIFGIIIVVFVFFFGYNRMSQKARGPKGGSVVARVDGATITRLEFQFAYDNTYKMYQNVFKGKEGEPLPEAVLKSVQSTALNQLIQQAVIKKLGDQLDLLPTKLELADAIRKSPVAKGEDGQFDIYMYKQRFLPYFMQKFNMNYEDLVAGDIVFGKVQNVFSSAGKIPTAKNFYDMENTKWTFDVTSYASEEDFKNKKNGSTNKYGAVTLSGRSQIFQAEADLSVYEKVFALAKTSGVADAQVGGKWYSVKLDKVEIPERAQWEKERVDYTRTLNSKSEQEFYQAWISSLLKDSKVKNYIQE